MRPFVIASLLAGVPLLMAFQADWRGDREIAMDLRQNGVTRDHDHTSVHFEPGALTDPAMDEFAGLVERGVTDIAAFAGVPLPDRKISFFVSTKIDISRARGRSIYLPLERVRTHTAPYLHETTHIVAPCEDCPLWMSEGYASYVQSFVSEHVGGYDGQIFTRNGNAGVDRDARRWLSNERGQAMFPFVGTDLDDPDLSDRRSAAAPYYVFAQSLMKFIVETTGTKQLTAIAARKDLAALREKWAASLQNKPI